MKMEQNLSLTPAQIQYLKIGPKVGNSTTATKNLQQSLDKFDIDANDNGNTLTTIPKFSFGNFQNTVSNFGVLLHRNFVGTTCLHQVQKFGKVAFSIDRQLQAQKDKQTQQLKQINKKSQIDPRTTLKGIYEHQSHKLLVTLKSFTIQSQVTQKTIQTLPLVYLKLIVGHISSSKLVKSIQNAMRHEGSSVVVIDYDKMQAKVNHIQNQQQKYQEGPYIFQRSGQQFNITLPSLQIYHSQSDYRACSNLLNKDILEIMQCDLDNTDQMVPKYFDLNLLQEHIQQITSQTDIPQ